ncbi:MAG: ABC transporter permease [Armatimonadota bacterium]|nr:ABC transporter permease [Armatimonadota bacterium]MDR7438883.1 ABC transporter permease [Armatimonadota bacterium]MDR7562423.1 ABC transporter permease [Armatimonadota bacterium]MDR7568131.1 ABC transporter permease [Armatimonadota bacterium]MDR7601503.1 ABC transporter permease [Armatimonadota bacterium]
MDVSLRGAFRFWQRNLLLFRRIFLTALPENFLEPVLYLVALGVGLGSYLREVDGIPYVAFVATGLAASAAMYGATFECTYNAYVQFAYDRAYEAIITTPLSAEDLAVGEVLWGATRSVIYGSAFLAVAALFGAVQSLWALLLPAVFFVAGLVFSALGLAFTALTPSIDLFTYYFSLWITPQFMFSGIFFPLEALPRWVQQAAWFAPLYHAVRATRAFAFGDPADAWGSLLWLTLAALVLLSVPAVLLRRRLVQ